MELRRNRLLIKSISTCLFGNFGIPFYHTSFYSWAILREAIDYVYSYGEQTGEYIFMKDPNKAMMRLFKVTQEDVDEDEPEDEL
jgi:hypothetical protein